MCCRNPSKGVVRLEKFIKTLFIIGQFRNRELKCIAASQHRKTIRGRFPPFVFIGQYCQTCNRSFVSVKNPVVVHKHPLGKLDLLCALHFNVDIYPAFIARKFGYPDQSVNKACTEFSILYHRP